MDQTANPPPESIPNQDAAVTGGVEKKDGSTDVAEGHLQALNTTTNEKENEIKNGTTDGTDVSHTPTPSGSSNTTQASNPSNPSGSNPNTTKGSPPVSDPETTKGDMGILKRIHKPLTSKFAQQRLKYFEPSFKPIPTSCFLMISGVVFGCIGGFLLHASNSTLEFSISYDREQCPLGAKNCEIPFTLEVDWLGDVYFYYSLTNFYQNNRIFLLNVNYDQILGRIHDTSGCHLFQSVNDLPMVPCGAFANAMFNDTFMLYYNDSVVPWTHNGIIWDVDRIHRFRNPPLNEGETLCQKFENTSAPPNWSKHFCELDPHDPKNNGFENADFIVWMRAAALNVFRKPYRILDRRFEPFTEGLPAGNYRLIVNNSYPVKAFIGKKDFLMATTSWAGGKNMFLGVSYITFGSLSILTGIALLLMHLKFKSNGMTSSGEKEVKL